MKEKEFVVYGLIDPETSELRYVGKSTNMQRRSKEYGCYKKSPTRHVEKWINSLLTKKKKPEIEILDTTKDENHLNELEIFYVSYFKSLGCRLTNHTNGGEGMSGFVYTLEQNLKNSKRQGGKDFIDQNGIVYYSPCQAAKKLGLDGLVIRTILKKNKAQHVAKGYSFAYIDETTDLKKLKEELQEKVNSYNYKRSLKILSHEGLLFNSIHECAKHYNISHVFVSKCCLNIIYKIHKKTFSYFNPETEDLEKEIEKLKFRLNYRDSDEFKRKQAADRGAKPFKDEKGNIYYSIAEAALKLNGVRSGIRRVLQGKQKEYKTHTFSYEI